MKTTNQHIFSLLDLTSLNDNDDITAITALCQKAVYGSNHVAAVCISPLFVKQAVQLLAGTRVKIATVANFPQATDALDIVTQSIQQSLQHGADEIDVVFPYKNFLAGDVDFAIEFVNACKKTCGEKILKVILETGALVESKLIAAASEVALIAGADFIKTSTGKIAVGATLPAAEAMLLTIKRLSPELKRPLGFKASGGVRTIEQASAYIQFASEMMGPDWVTPAHFRIGASQLAQDLIQ